MNKGYVLDSLGIVCLLRCLRRLTEFEDILRPDGFWCFAKLSQERVAFPSGLCFIEANTGALKKNQVIVLLSTPGLKWKRRGHPFARGSY